MVLRTTATFSDDFSENSDSNSAIFKSDFWILTIWDGERNACRGLLYSRRLFDNRKQWLGVMAVTLSVSCVLSIDLMKHSMLICISGYIILGHAVFRSAIFFRIPYTCSLSPERRPGLRLKMNS
jgi:hypothetical protein